MKKALSLILSLIMIFVALPVTSFAADCKHLVGEWVYWSYSGPTQYGDCTDPAYKIMRAGYCTLCNAYLSETIPVQENHKLKKLPMYDSEGKPVVNETDGDLNYVAPGCEKTGHMKYECLICGTIVTETLPATGHEYGEEEVYIKCFDPDDESEEIDRESAGISRKYCIVEGCYAYEEVKSSHTIYEGGAKATSCYEAGHTAYKFCLECSTESPSQTIEKLSHIDANADGKCDLCLSEYREDTGVYCSCVCHSENSFIQLIMPLLRLIWQLLGVETCHGDCETLHYEK